MIEKFIVNAEKQYDKIKSLMDIEGFPPFFTFSEINSYPFAYQT